MTEWVVTLQRPDGMKFRDFFEGSSAERVTLFAEQYYSNCDVVDVELVSDETWQSKFSFFRKYDIMEKYFVVSYDGESPAQLYFNKKLAEDSLARYYDSFDEKGNHLSSYRLVLNDEKYSYLKIY